jgi:hypothetical protein
MKKIVLIFIAISLLGSSSVALLTRPTQADSFNQNDLMDDAVFDNSTSMSTAQIQAFLASFPNSCLTNYSAPYPSDYFTYGANAPASAIIEQAATTWGINPKVILATLEKEESLVTGNTGCASWQYNSAVGMGCPDGGTCPAPAYAGFSQQVMKGMWQLKFSEERAEGNMAWDGDGDVQYYGFMTAGTRARIQGGATAYYDGTASIDGTTVTMTNGATAALYTYTPHFHGNQNFVTIFNSWFGSTQFPQPIGGSLYYQISTGGIYLINNSTRYYIPSQAMLNNYGLNVFPALPVSDTVINGLTDGGTLSNLTWDTSGVYLVNNGVRYHVSSDMCTAWGLSCFDSSKLTPLNATFQTQYLQQGGELSNLTNINGVIYEMLGGNREPIANPKTLSDLGFASNPVLQTSDVNSQEPLGALLMTTPGVIQFSPTSAIYYFDGTNYFQVSDIATYNDWSLSNAPQVSTPNSSYAQTPPTSTLLTSWALYGGKEYIIDQGKKALIPDSLTNLWPSSLFSAQPTQLFNSLPTKPLTALVWTNPDFYYLNNGKKHHITSISDLSILQSSLGAASSISSNKINSITSGSNYLSDGTLVSIQDGTGKIYVVNNQTLTYIPNPAVFNEYGFNWSAIQSYPTTLLSDYPLDTSEGLTNSIASDGTHYFMGSSGLYQLPSALAKDFGAIDASFVPINKQIVTNSSPVVSRFLYNTDNGRIYYASGSAIHYVATMSAFAAYGGTAHSPIAVNSTIINLFVEAQSLN